MPRGKKLDYYTFTKNVLDERLELVRNGINPPETDIRHFSYEARYRFLLENPECPGVEYGSDSKKFYVNWSGTVLNYLKQHCDEFGIDRNRWWILRDKLNINAKGKGICESESGSFIIDYSTRQKVAEGCSFILICEKSTVSKELANALREKGYKLSLISSGGKDPADVKEATIQAVESLEQDNFFILHLHDYDLDGIEMTFTLKDHYDKVIDIGVNRHFLKHLGKIDSRLVEEQKLNKRFMHEIQDRIKAFISPLYTVEDFNYLQGEQRSKKEWLGKRIEIDAIHVQYGIKPFVDYIESRLDDIKCWDLTRIGFERQELNEPDNEYESLITDKENEVTNAYDEKLNELSETYNEIIDTIKHTLTRPPEYDEIQDKYIDSSLSPRDIEPLRIAYDEYVNKEWKPEYQAELDAEVNDKLSCWSEKVTTAKADIESIVEEKQEKLDSVAIDDPGLDAFSEELDNIEWGEDELDSIDIPDPVDEIQRAIDALEKLKRQKEAATQ